MRRALPTLIAIILVVAVVFILVRNKKEIDASTELSLAKVEVRPVRAVQVGPLADVLIHTASGQLVASKELMLTAATQGQVSELMMEKGQAVKKGQVLASVENDLLREQMQVARAAYEKLDKDMERYRVMLENDAITRQQFETLQLNYRSAEAKYKAAQKQLADSRIKSPIDGIINQIFTKQGAMIGPGVPICEIINNTSLMLRLKLSERESARLRQAQRLVVVINDVDSLSARLASQGIKPDYTGLLETDLILEGATEAYSPGMSATAVIENVPLPGEIFIPQNALLGFGSTQLYVFCAEDGVARRKNVEVSENIKGWVKIADGLAHGDSVITDGNTLISDGDKISIRP
jgi:RND family efflux transporter MFP subunit